MYAKAKKEFALDAALTERKEPEIPAEPLHYYFQDFEFEDLKVGRLVVRSQRQKLAAARYSALQIHQKSAWDSSALAVSLRAWELPLPVDLASLEH